VGVHVLAKDSEPPLPEQVLYLYFMVDKGEYNKFVKPRVCIRSLKLAPYNNSNRAWHIEPSDSVARLTGKEGTPGKVGKGQKDREGIWHGLEGRKRKGEGRERGGGRMCGKGVELEHGYADACC